MATRVGYDMESIAVDIKHNLEGQSRKMERISEKMEDIDLEAGIANRHIGEIKKTKSVNRLILYGVIVAILTAFIIVVAVKFT